jgi:hypothetical protein
MSKTLVFSMALIATVCLAPVRGTTSVQLSGVPTCFHDRAERDVDRQRREQALALAKAVNAAQGTAAERTRVYVPLSRLGKLPPTPRGFELRLYTDATGYVVSLKDVLDPCKYAIFSDESGLLYEKTPMAAPVLATGS